MKPITPVPILKNGRLSKAISLNTTAERYVNTVRDMNFNLADYADIIGKLAMKPYITKDFIPVNNKLLEMAGEYINGFIMRSKLPNYRQPNKFICSFCDYKDKCFADIFDPNIINSENFESEGETDDAE